MTKNEFYDLHESLCYGHDAELIVSNQNVFIEWGKNAVELFHIKDGNGNKMCTISGNNNLEIINALFATSIFGKTLNNHYKEFEIVDIE